MTQKIKLGAGFDPNEYQSNPQYRNIIKNNFDFVIPTWGLMPKDCFETQEFSQKPDAEAGIDLAIADGLEVQGHCLLTRFNIPDWLKSYESQGARNDLALFRTHIYQVVNYWKDRINSWVVANEMITSGGATPAHPWVTHLGQGLLQEAFNAVSDANPRAELWLNEFGLQNPQHWDHVYEQVKNLVYRKVKITGVAAHLHVNLFPVRTRWKIVNFAANLYPYHGIRKNLLRTQIKRFQDLGLEFHASEMTIWPETNHPNRVKAQGKLYRDYLKLACDHGCSRASFWSPVDDSRNPALTWHWQGKTDYPGIWAWDQWGNDYVKKFNLFDWRDKGGSTYFDNR